MLIGLVGAACAGKEEVAGFLTEENGFVRLEIDSEKGLTSLRTNWWRANENAVVVFRFVSALSRREDPMKECIQNALLELRKRPYFLLVGVDAPPLVRYKRYCEKNNDQSDVLTLEQFLEREEKYIPAVRKNTKYELHSLMQKARVSVLNSFGELGGLHAELRRLDLQNPTRLRPNWDHYFLRLADLASARTNCMKRRVGAVIVKENRVVSTGYNGTPSRTPNCNQGGCARCNAFASAGSALGDCMCCHAEENAIVEAGRDRCRGATLYTNLFPCLGCTKKIAQAEIVRVVFATSYATDEMSYELFRAAGVVVERLKDPVFLETS